MDFRLVEHMQKRRLQEQIERNFFSEKNQVIHARIKIVIRIKKTFIQLLLF